MNTSQRIVKNTSAIIASDIIGMILGFIFIAAFARYLGTNSYGLFSFVTSFVLLFKVFFDVGLNTLIIRDVGRERDKLNYYFSNVATMELVIAAIIISITGIYLNLGGSNPESNSLIFLFVVIYIFETFVSLIGGTFNALECREYEAIVRIVGKILYVCFGLLGIYLHFDLIRIVILLLISTILKLLLSLSILMWKNFIFKFEIDPTSWHRLFFWALPFALGGVFFDVYFNIDMTMLFYLKGSDSVGLYSVAYRFISMFMIIPAALSSSILPLISRYFIQSKDNLIFTCQKAIGYLLILSIPLAIGITVVADIVILTIFGKQYVGSIPALQILVWTTVFFFITYISGNTLVAINKQIQGIFCLIICIFLNVCLNLFLIPIYDFMGASLATVITEIALLILYNYVLSKNGINTPYLTLAYKPIIAGISMGIILLIVKNSLSGMSNFFQLCVLIPIGIAFYFSILIILKTFKEDDIRIFRQILGKKIA